MRNAALAAFVLALMATHVPPSDAAPLTSAGRLARLLVELTQDQPLDAEKFDRLILAALSNDLVIDRAESAFLANALDKADPEGFADAPAEVTPTFEGSPPSGWVARAQKLLVSMLRATALSGQTATSLGQLAAIALRHDLSAQERDRILTLIAHYRQASTAHITRDPLAAIEAALIDPDSALRTIEHRRQLELIERRGNMPSLLRGTLGASGSTRP